MGKILKYHQPFKVFAIKKWFVMALLCILLASSAGWVFAILGLINSDLTGKMLYLFGGLLVYLALYFAPTVSIYLDYWRFYDDLTIASLTRHYPKSTYFSKKSLILLFGSYAILFALGISFLLIFN